MIKGILVFDYNIYKQLKRFNEINNNYKIVYINNFHYYHFEYENNKLKDFEINPKISKASYIMKELSGIEEIYSIINNNSYNHYLTFSIKKLLLNKPIILGINLLEVSKENFINSINNAYPLKKEIYNKVLLKQIVKNISRKYIGQNIKDIIDKYIPLSYNELSFLLFLYNHIEKENNKYIFKEIVSHKNIGYKNFKTNSNYITIIQNIKKLFPTIEEDKIINKINNFYYGLESKNYDNILSYNFNLKEEFKQLLLNSKEKIKEDINININFSDFYINNLKHNFNSLLEKNIYIIVFILNLLKIGNLEFIEENIKYKTKKGKEKIIKYYTPYITQELVDTLKKFNIEIFNIETIINKNPKLKILTTKKNHISKSFIYEDTLFKIFDLDIKYFNYLLDKYENNGLIKIKNTNIEITNKCIFLLEHITINIQENILNKINNFYEKLHETNLNKSSIIKYTNLLFDKYFPHLINNNPTFKQINLIKNLIKNNNIDIDINNIKTKQQANNIINKYLKPSEKQIQYALNIAEKLNIKIENECLNNKTCIENFIKEKRKELYKKPTEKMINFAKKLSKEHNIPLSNDILEDFYKTQKFINKII